MALVGAVRMMDRMQTFSIFSAYSCSMEFTATTPKTSTWTVALDMQAKATKSFSLRFSLQPIPQTTVLSILIRMATSKIPTQIETTEPSSSLILIAAPVKPKRIGSKIIQKISKAVAAGLSSISQPTRTPVKSMPMRAGSVVRLISQPPKWAAMLSTISWKRWPLGGAAVSPTIAYTTHHVSTPIRPKTIQYRDSASESSSSSSIMLMSLMEGLRLYLLFISKVVILGCLVLVRNLGPRMVVSRAPVGTVIIMDSTQVLTCTIALHIQAIPTNTFSFKFNLHPMPTIVVAASLTRTPMITTVQPVRTTFVSSSWNLILAPAILNRIGWKIRQKISKAVEAGLSSICHPYPTKYRAKQGSSLTLQLFVECSIVMQRPIEGLTKRLSALVLPVILPPDFWKADKHVILKFGDSFILLNLLNFLSMKSLNVYM
nr:unnamed protein product [Callosobruchus analis]